MAVVVVSVVVEAILGVGSVVVVEVVVVVGSLVPWLLLLLDPQW